MPKADVQRPLVAVLIPRPTQREVLDEKTRAELDAHFVVRYPTSEGKIETKEAQALLAEAQGCLTGWGSPQLGKELLDRAPGLKIMAHSAGTVKPYVSDELWNRQIVVTSAAASMAVDVAQYTLGLMVIGRKNIMELAPQVSSGEWRSPRSHRPPNDLRGSTVGIVAASHVGKYVLSLLKHFGVEVLLSDPFVNAEQARNLGAKKVELEELFAASDIVSIHAPSLPTTKHLVNAARLASMKHGAILINTARGSLVDEAALVQELKKKRIWAFLDVTDPEPPPPGSPLYGCPHLTLSPHIAGSIGIGRLQLGRMAFDELKRYFAGEAVQQAVTKEMLARIG